MRHQRSWNNKKVAAVLCVYQTFAVQKKGSLCICSIGNTSTWFFLFFIVKLLASPQTAQRFAKCEFSKPQLPHGPATIYSLCVLEPSRLWESREIWKPSGKRDSSLWLYRRLRNTRDAGLAEEAEAHLFCLFLSPVQTWCLLCSAGGGCWGEGGGMSAHNDGDKNVYFFFFHQWMMEIDNNK